MIDILFYNYINKFQFYIFYTFYLWTDPPKDDPTNEIIGISLTLLMKNKWKKWIRFNNREKFVRSAYDWKF